MGNQSVANIDNVITYLKPGEDYAFYANLDTLETSANFASWELVLLHTDSFTIAYPNFATLKKDQLSGGYRFYVEATCPATAPTGCFYPAVLDRSNSDQVVYIFNKIGITTTKIDLTLIRYRNAKNILNFNYEGLTTYYNKHYIWMTYHKQQQFPVDTLGYDLVAGSFQPIRTVIGKNRDFLTIFFNEDDHAAFTAATIHSQFEIKEDGNWVHYRRTEDANYSPEWVENFPLAEGSITMQRVDSFSSNKAL